MDIRAAATRRSEPWHAKLESLENAAETPGKPKKSKQMIAMNQTNLKNESKLDDMGSFEMYKNRVENGVENEMLSDMAFKGS